VVKSPEGNDPPDRSPPHLEIFFVSDGNSETDLFGEPVLERSEGRGRPEHLRTRESSNKVLLMFALGRSEKQAATAIGVSVPTLRKHYFSECQKRRDAALKLEATQLSRLNEQAQEGNVTAEKELFKQLDRLRMRDQAASFAPVPVVKQGRADKLGKKEAAAQAAEQVRGLYEPPPPPSRMN